MLQNFCFQGLGELPPEQCNGGTLSIFESGGILAETITTPLEKSNGVWGDGLFTFPELGADLQGDINANNTDKSCYRSNDNFQPVCSQLCDLAHVENGNENTRSFLTEPKGLYGYTQCQNPAPSVSFVKKQQREQLGITPIKIDLGSPSAACSVVYTSQPNQLNLSLLSTGGATMASNCSSNNNILYQQTSLGSSTLSNGISTFLTTQNEGNFVMVAPSLSTQQFCIPTAPHTMFSCYVVAPSQHALDVNEAIAYPSLATASQAMGTMCGQWNSSVLPTVRNPMSTSAGVPTALSAMQQTFAATGSTTASQSVLGFALGESSQSSGTLPSVSTCTDSSSINHKQQPKGSPPSYDSIRAQLTRRRQQPGRQRSGTNVHGSLQGGCAYFSYNLSAALKQYEQPDLHLTKVGEQVLPIFIQMFPCELRDRTVIVLNRVIEATCSLDSATVVGIEPRSETSFIALVRTNSVWQLIHKLRCRVLMDRHGFWYAENMEQYRRLKEYCEGVRRLPQQIRHLQTDGLPCMPLVVELSRSVDPAAVTSPQAPPPFDEVEPIATVERHTRGSNNSNREKSLTMDDDSDEAVSPGERIGGWCN